MDTVFRIQDAKGEGPYQGQEGEFLENMNNNHSGCSIHPIPYCDKGIGRSPELEERCGFRNMEQLKSWFTDHELEGLSKLGFVIAQIKGEITVVGQHQVLFIPA